MTVLLNGCAIIGREYYYAPSCENGRIQDTSAERTIIHSTVLPRSVAIQKDDVRLTVDNSNHGYSTLMIGPLIPILPGFLFNWMGGDEPTLDTETVSVRLGVVPADRKVGISFEQVSLASTQLKGVQLPSNVEILGYREVLGTEPGTPRRSIEYIETAESTVVLPSESHYSTHDGEYYLILRYDTGQSQLESFEVRLGGVTVDGVELEPIDIAYDCRSGWTWEMGP